MMTDLENSEHEPDDADAATVTPRRNARGVVLVGARILTGTIGIAVAVVTVAAAGWLPLPIVSTAPSSTTVVPVPTDQQRVCAGPVLRLGSDSGEGATTVTSIGTPYVVSAASAGKVAASALQSTDSVTGVTPMQLTLPPASSGSSAVPLLAGSQTQSVVQGDITGFAAAECSEASGDSWLVGGATTTGRTSLLTMSNPGEVIATVDLTVYTEGGEITAAGTEGIVVPPGGQRILSIAGFAPGATSIAVRVHSRGSQVVSQLQQAVVRTLEPGGVDVIGSTTAPAKLAVIPGLVLAEPDAIAARSSAAGYDDLATVLRFLVPGSKPASVQITITPESGTAAPAVVNTTLEAGKVTEMPLRDFPPGSYTVTVRSNVPLVAAARSSVYTGSMGTDFAWFASAPHIQKKALVAVGRGPSPEVHLANLGDQDATISVTQNALEPGSTSSAATTMTIRAKAAIMIPVQSLRSYTITGFDQLAISVSYAGDGALASYPVSPTGPASQPIAVYRH
jgi:hypothetical protein